MTSFQTQIDAILTNHSGDASDELERKLAVYDINDVVAVVAKRAATGGGGNGGESSVLPSEPTDGSLVAGDCKLWFSDTAGAPTLHVKSKDANGAVFTATIPLTAA